MKLKNNFLRNYLASAPMALAIERSLECNILSKQEFIHPVLDMGCGDGLFAYTLFDETVDTGIDLNAKELKRAGTYNVYGEIINCSINCIPRKDGSYNTIFSNSTLEHVSDLDGTLKEAHRLLAKGGQFYVTVPNDAFDRFTVLYQVLSFYRLKGIAERYRNFYNRFWRHYHCRKREDWQEVFGKAGFRITGAQKYGSKAICLINDLLVPFALASFAVKKTFNRWILLRPLRRFYIYPFYLIARALIRRYESEKSGGLIFFALSKS